jgi:uncharacterized protein YdhG (YjbR/CyaY superfamily)
VETKQPAPADIDAYIAGFPPEIQEILQTIRAIVREEAPGAQEAIRYQMPTFVLGGNLVHFAAFQRHIGFYPTPSGTEAFCAELASYAGGKGSIRFPLDQPMPYDLIRRIVAFRAAEMREKAAQRPARRRAKRE